MPFHFLRKSCAVADRKAFRFSEALPEALPRAQNLIRSASQIMTRPKHFRDAICEVEKALKASPIWVALTALVSRRKSTLFVCERTCMGGAQKRQRFGVRFDTRISALGSASARCMSGACFEPTFVWFVVVSTQRKSIGMLLPQNKSMRIHQKFWFGVLLVQSESILIPNQSYLIQRNPYWSKTNPYRSQTRIT